MTPQDLRNEYEECSLLKAKAFFGASAPVQVQGLADPRYVAWLEVKLCTLEVILDELQEKTGANSRMMRAPIERKLKRKAAG